MKCRRKPRNLIVLSSSAAEADRADAYRLGANGYLVKPSATDELVHLVEAIKDLWLSPNAPPPNALGFVEWNHALNSPFRLSRDGGPASPERALLGFIREHNFRVLNVAGPRASKELEVYGFVRELLKELYAAGKPP